MVHKVNNLTIIITVKEQKLNCWLVNINKLYIGLLKTQSNVVCGITVCRLRASISTLSLENWHFNAEAKIATQILPNGTESDSQGYQSVVKISSPRKTIPWIVGLKKKDNDSQDIEEHKTYL